MCVRNFDYWCNILLIVTKVFLHETVSAQINVQQDFFSRTIQLQNVSVGILLTHIVHLQQMIKENLQNAKTFWILYHW